MRTKAKTKRPMSEAQRAALEKAQAKRRANLASARDQALHGGDDAINRRIADESLPQEIIYGSAKAENEGSLPAVETAPADPFQLFLLGLSAETREMLSDDELQAIYVEQLSKALAEKKAGLKSAARETALHAARMEAGLIPAATAEAMTVAKRNAEIVSAVIELPPAGADGQVADVGIRIDQKVFLHGHRYEFTRAQWDSYREILYRAAQHELEFAGQNTRQRRYLLGRAMGSVNAHIALNPDGSLA